jgi:hypothetical protein
LKSGVDNIRNIRREFTIQEVVLGCTGKGRFKTRDGNLLVLTCLDEGTR